MAQELADRVRTAGFAAAARSADELLDRQAHGLADTAPRQRAVDGGAGTWLDVLGVDGPVPGSPVT